MAVLLGWRIPPRTKDFWNPELALWRGATGSAVLGQCHGFLEARQRGLEVTTNGPGAETRPLKLFYFW